MTLDLLVMAAIGLVIGFWWGVLATRHQNKKLRKNVADFRLALGMIRSVTDKLPDQIKDGLEELKTTTSNADLREALNRMVGVAGNVELLEDRIGRLDVVLRDTQLLSDDAGPYPCPGS